MELKTRINISGGNIKLGSIPSISLPPDLTCKGRPCNKKCYARKMERIRPNVKKAWQRNAQALSENTYFTQLYMYLEDNHPEMFRFHVGGDIPNQAYFNSILDIANSFKDTKFLVFTKNYNLNFKNIPENLSVVISMWPDLELTDKQKSNVKGLPKAWMLDKKELDDRIPQKAFECRSDCSKCAACWNLKFLKLDVVFHKH